VDEHIMIIVQRKINIQRLVKHRLRVAARYPSRRRSQTPLAR
jgi:hypothetical protein